MTPNKPRTPSAQNISALLRTAGFEKSESSGTRIRGWHSHSPGYVVRRGDAPGEVKVHHELGNFRTSDADRQERDEEEEAYAVAIEAAGFAVQRQEGGYFAPLIVTAETEEA